MNVKKKKNTKTSSWGFAIILLFSDSQTVFKSRDRIFIIIIIILSYDIWMFKSFENAYVFWPARKP